LPLKNSFAMNLILCRVRGRDHLVRPDADADAEFHAEFRADVLGWGQYFGSGPLSSQLRRKHGCLWVAVGVVGAF
jgi:hypothetical protein